MINNAIIIINIFLYIKYTYKGKCVSICNKNPN